MSVVKLNGILNCDGSIDSDINRYEFGDIISINNEKDKKIFISSSSDILYYVSLDSIELFSGINTSDFINIVKKEDKLNEEQKNKLIRKIKL